ncbi:pyrrolo-quinoline quinone beta-propeller repeat protein [Natronococcus amylolyticus DSM 10524]|uniref:Pyrrolo-quinoline quinone beta-propeller repeat protein n=1 Tax=Natronococcus amylolyticus DSM 10524 TaxID=1227497 RepID=L9XE29_9EURY|nr:PQQ-binding-like beta-propeller repeat protein [Natronococcus amylolyticus]ELY59701.1 pyrrolo-quinoline quinone beta-propeller repeat protein [Natronococcus amylolyticus DSM 10524]
MTKWRRRSVLATGATLTAGGALASIGAGEESTDDLPDPDRDPNPGMDEDWPSFDGDAGHARYVPDGTALDGDALEAAWSVDFGFGRDAGVAVADDVVYATNANGVVALDVADGSIIWENTDVDANAPSVVDDTVYVTGDELFALDIADGSVRWQTEFEPEDPIQSQTVAYGGVFVVVNGTLYALETDDGSVRWEIDTLTAETQHDDEGEQEYDFLDTTAAANGVVYAGAGDLEGGATVALDPDTGDEVWRGDSNFYTGGAQARATSTAVVVSRVDFYARVLLDAQTGEHIAKVSAEGISVTLGKERYLSGYEADQLTGSAYHGDEDDWGVDVSRNVGRAIIAGDTVYVYFRGTDATYGEYDGELVALDKDDGSERWAIQAGELPVGNVLGISDETLYVEHEDSLVALREEDDGDEETGEDDEGDEGDGENGDDAEDDGEEDESEETADDDRGDGDDEDDDDGEEESEDQRDDHDEQYDGDEEGEADDNEGVADDEDESENGDDEQYDGEEYDSDDDGDDEIDDSEEDDIGDEDDSDDEDGDIGDEDDVDDSEEDDIGDEDNSDDEDGDIDDDEADSVPGFTTGAGLVSGALGLEWLRRRAAADEQADAAAEPPTSGEERTE